MLRLILSAIAFLLSIIISFVGGYYFNEYLISNNRGNQLITVTSHYFEIVSREGWVIFSNYSDCELEGSTEIEQGQGIDIWGNCSFTSDEISFFYSAALDSKANLLFFEFGETQQ